MEQRATLQDRERAAMQRAIHSNGAALVERIRHGVYVVPSAERAGVRYVVTGTGTLARELACTCEAGQRGLPCWHRAAVQVRKAGENAIAQARKMGYNPPSFVERAASTRRVAL